MVSESPRAHGQRLTVLRHIHGLTQSALAKQLEVTQSFLSQVERGNRPIPDALVQTAARKYGLPGSFFFVPPSPVNTGTLTFRKTSRASVRDEERVAGLYDEAARLFRTVSAQSGFTTADLPDSAEYREAPEQVARSMRQAVGLADDAPVLNATRTLERFGIGVVDQLDTEVHAGGHTGVSRPSRLNDRPLVALAEDVPGAVKRLTLLHEVGHLIGDRDLTAPITSRRSPEEQRAFRFAGSFLLPEPVVKSCVSESLNLHGYLPIKADYGISVPAIIRRARDLRVISEQRYRSLSIQLSSQGWRTNEPVEVADERPILLGQALRQVYGQQPHARASHETGVAPEWIHRWTRSADEPAAPLPKAGQVISLDAARTRRSS